MDDNFFVSDSLKDVLNAEMLTESSFNSQVQESGETPLSGNFVSLSLSEHKMILAVSQKVAKSLLRNPDTQFAISFMDEIWSLTSSEMKLRLDKEGTYHVTLSIIDRRKEDTYERTI